ncbi:hypothetical protein [Deinococcus ruber]|uniref:Uncharacterized protein n=1 Tax=Deinococcus ruber TaxID=1848197 RepID=A0A918F597_9DEIO|nr:hypothetical protein [Deinococcus ruber]GGR10113.1 hypothetical protein GCM10008957_23650 [Deinococcus ruber]
MTASPLSARPSVPWVHRSRVMLLGVVLLAGPITVLLVGESERLVSSTEDLLSSGFLLLLVVSVLIWVWRQVRAYRVVAAFVPESVRPTLGAIVQVLVVFGVFASGMGLAGALAAQVQHAALPDDTVSTGLALLMAMAALCLVERREEPDELG